MQRRSLIRRPAPAVGELPLSALQKRQVRQMLRAVQEIKVLDVNTGSTSVTTAGVTAKLSSVAQGASQNQRVGDQLLAKQLQFMYTITVGATGLIAAADQYNTVRVIIFEWHQDDGLAAPTVANILDTGLSVTKTISAYNWDTNHDYRILYDQSHVVFNTPIWNGAAVTWSHGVGGTFATSKPVTIPLSHKLDYDASTTFGTRMIYALFISDSAFTPNPTIEMTSRFLFEDS